jgi:hypothetical protein
MKMININFQSKPAKIRDLHRLRRRGHCIFLDVRKFIDDDDQVLVFLMAIVSAWAISSPRAERVSLSLTANSRPALRL